jgi:hypothetical protein
MLLKNIKALAVSALMLLGVSTSAFASHTVYVHETFGSGAAFDGSLTFSNDYLALESGTGSLTGGTYGSILLNNAYYGHPSEVPVAGTLGNDWLADGPAYGTAFGTDYHFFLGFAWKLSGGDLMLLHTDSVTPYLSELTNDVDSDYDHVLTTTVSLTPPAPPTTSPIPEPASVLLLGAGIAALVGMRRRKAA